MSSSHRSGGGQARPPQASFAFAFAVLPLPPTSNLQVPICLLTVHVPPSLYDFTNTLPTLPLPFVDHCRRKHRASVFVHRFAAAAFTAKRPTETARLLAAMSPPRKAAATG